MSWDPCSYWYEFLEDIELPIFNIFFIFLSACQNGFYGEGCSEMCNNTCTGCNHINGSCDSGCLQGWKGEFCHIGRVQQF